MMEVKPLAGSRYSLGGKTLALSFWGMVHVTCALPDPEGTQKTVDWIGNPSENFSSKPFTTQVRKPSVFSWRELKLRKHLEIEK